MCPLLSVKAIVYNLALSDLSPIVSISITIYEPDSLDVNGLVIYLKPYSYILTGSFLFKYLFNASILISNLSLFQYK